MFCRPQRAEEELERAESHIRAGSRGAQRPDRRGRAGHRNGQFHAAQGARAAGLRSGEYKKIKAAVEKDTEVDRQRAQEIASVRAWADTFNSASIATKRMVLTALIDRVEVARKYKIDIPFRLAVGQYRSEYCEKVLGV